ncbi:hypothetical protein Pst134EB_005700 [Puccinia striiformis f. sp. tritici]|nr:hypothetical protein Pst134EB_005700 [Puccinia striiformis f. sp. tritici]
MYTKISSTHRVLAKFAVIAVLTVCAFQVAETAKPKPQKCSKAFNRSYEGDPDVTCLTQDNVSYDCHVNKCYIYDGGKKLPYSAFNFKHCHRFADVDEGVSDATDQTIHPETFRVTSTNTLDGMGTQPGIKGQHYFQCSWTGPNDVNANRPWCDDCSLTEKPKELFPLLTDPHGAAVERYWRKKSSPKPSVAGDVNGILLDARKATWIMKVSLPDCKDMSYP